MGSRVSYRIFCWGGGKRSAQGKITYSALQVGWDSEA